MDLGQDRRGVDMGPSAIRYARLQDALEELGYASPTSGTPRPIPETVEEGGKRSATWQPCGRLRGGRRAGRGHGLGGALPDLPRRRPLDRHRDRLGGRASRWSPHRRDLARRPRRLQHPGDLAVGQHPRHAARRPDRPRHPDLVGIGGRARACSPEDVVIIGLRSVDLEEKELIREAGVRVYTMKEIDLRHRGVVRRALKDLSHLDRVHLSFDLDVVDPDVAPGVGTPIRGGLTYREAHLVMELVNEAGIISSLDVVEVNPILDDRNGTAALAVELVASLMGRRIIDLPDDERRLRSNRCLAPPERQAREAPER